MVEVGSVKWNADDPKSEEAADAFLKEALQGVNVYTERQLARKIRLENARLPEVEETTMPPRTADYLVRQQLKLMVESARLTKPQAALLALVVEGWRLIDISEHYAIPYEDVLRRFRIVCWKIKKGGSPYDGLYEVYWREVNRHIYRKPHSGNEK